MDPWFFPHMNDRTLKSADHQKSLIIMTETWPNEVKKKSNNTVDTHELIESFN
jgi:hypothetical protein